MPSLKPLTKEAIPRALEKAERYRLLNEPVEAESICADILAIDPENQAALVTFLLTLTEQFEEGLSGTLLRARDVATRLVDPYARVYYAGLVAERHAKAQLRRGGPGSVEIAHHALVDAMALYEKAEAVRPPGNDDALLRYNTCVRLMERHPHVGSPDELAAEPPLE